ncbi:MAG TPA: DNA primase [Thermoanaerobaculia bacterium]|jgi:DNA primase|nr:DNA primase [Thermoanaerobaculia bacterium]
MALGNVHITPQLVQAVRDAVDIVSIASEHTKLRKAGRRYQGLCPIHKEKTPSFSVDPVQGLFYCFGCGAGGDAIKLHMMATGDDFPAAIESLATRYGIPLPSRETKAGSKTERDLEGALEAAATFFTDQLRKSSFALGYLERRRIPPELIERFGLGFAPDDWRTLLKSLTPRIPLADLEAAGLVARPERGGDPYDRFRNRLMFPIHNASGRLVGFGGRTLGDDKAKYINSNETDRFHKGLLLYGMHLAKKEIRESGRAVLCEGYFDVIGAVACGLEGAVAGMGTALTPEQTKQLARFAEEVVVSYDGDNAGENAFRRALPLLLGEGLAVRRARFPGNHDPDSLRLEAGMEAVVAAVQEAGDAVVAEIERLAPPEAGREPQIQAKAASAVTELLRPIPDPILRFSYARIAAERLGVPVEMMSRRIGSGPQSAQSSAGPARPAAGPKRDEGLSWNIEKLVLAQLLDGTEAIPPAEDLPPPEAFLDPECRNIYQIFCALYAEGTGSPPDARAVLAGLGAEGQSVDLMAGILLERNFTSGVSGRLGLLESLEKLEDRWRKQRNRELAAWIREAEVRKDSARLETLLQEKSRLNQGLHRGFRWTREGV